ncbi:DUF2637 domain-containing protein [Actinacidiphila sp. bgisy167]|uniref:DUF2637 domain-containing protein n=1 Tax=Actinacidiphila sp. bgisy167 TaxID=3413797 RepID=UPI003D735ADD
MPSTTTDTAHRTPARASAAIRIGIALLGTVGFALSYDALRQMAAAIHVRNLLTYTFPLVIDGFIAIGVGALVLLRTAPLPARLYVWALVGAATATSVWANALHAIRLNQQTTGTGLHLGDTTVAVLSAIAPLALAGATHLHILVTRSARTTPARIPAHPATGPVPYRQQSPDGTPTDVPYQEIGQLDRNDLPQPRKAEAIPSAPAPAPDAQESSSTDPDSGLRVLTPTASVRNEPVGEPDDAAQGPGKGSVPRGGGQGGRPPMATLEELAEVIAAAHPDPQAITRDSARNAVTESGLGAATTRLTDAITLVRRAAQTGEHLKHCSPTDRT